jgi:hypothetical protein
MSIKGDAADRQDRHLACFRKPRAGSVDRLSRTLGGAEAPLRDSEESYGRSAANIVPSGLVEILACPDG